MICPTTTFSLHKPEGWKAPLNLLFDEYNKDCEALIEGIFMRAGTDLTEIELQHEFNKAMADKYGILYRVGTHVNEKNGGD